MRVAYLFLTILISFYSCQNSKSPDNPYGLKVISNFDEYLNTVALNPNNELVDLSNFVEGIVLDIRYATPNNFTGEKIYDSPKAYARRPVAEALKKINEELAQSGLGIKVFDAYRPYSATVKFYEVMKGDTNFVAAPWKGSKHNRGCAVDVTLIDINTGNELAMPTAFDDFTEKAAVDHPDLPEEVLRNRQLLLDVMTSHGFDTYAYEWWHFDLRGWESFDILDISFEAIGKNND